LRSWKRAAPKMYGSRWSEYLTIEVYIIAAVIIGVIMLYLLWREIDLLF
jgi:hypothetical protein